jgi:hypothetical protein
MGQELLAAGMSWLDRWAFNEYLLKKIFEHFEQGKQILGHTMPCS